MNRCGHGPPFGALLVVIVALAGTSLAAGDVDGDGAPDVVAAKDEGENRIYSGRIHQHTGRSGDPKRVAVLYLSYETILECPAG